MAGLSPHHTQEPITMGSGTWVPGTESRVSAQKQPKVTWEYSPVSGTSFLPASAHLVSIALPVAPHPRPAVTQPHKDSGRRVFRPCGEQATLPANQDSPLKCQSGCVKSEEEKRTIYNCKLELLSPGRVVI